MEVRKYIGLELPNVVGVPCDTSRHGGDINATILRVVNVESIGRKNTKNVDVFVIEGREIVLLRTFAPPKKEDAI